MAGKSKRTTAPVPPEFPWPTAQPVRPPAAQPVPPATAQSIPLPAIPSMFASGSWLPPRPPQSMAASSPPCWLAGVAQPSDFSAQGSWWTPPAGIAGSAQPTPPPGNLEVYYNLQAWGFDSHSPGDFLSFFANTSSHTQAVENGTSSQPINVGDNTNGDDCARRKTLAMDKRRILDCGESDVDLKKRAMQIYEEDHKEDGPFMFHHCWEVLEKEPKWDAYLERLEDLELEKRKFSVDDEVGKHFTLDDARDERPPGGKQAKEQRKRKRKGESCIIDLDDELSKFVDAQIAANEGRKEMLETQRRVSSENLEARKLACVAAKEQKERVSHARDISVVDDSRHHWNA